ncbi:hypothetical protein E3N88_25146 [Mikania micrantha]|uniref:Uncharacterized protein n=1 Tax=Mikania micrantha TaxID=192012 RepID=A0A5N6N6S9_9ASTR|nr:hypothetical protein E3N88_25146 [Mikania micrantha]
MVSAAAERGGGLDSPVPGGTPTPAIGYSLRVWVLMVVIVTATVVKRIPRSEWLPAVRLGGAVGGDGAEGRENPGVVGLLAGASC